MSYKSATLANFLRGFGSILEIWPNTRPRVFRRVHRTAASDWAALCEDGRKVARDWMAAAEKMRSELTHAR
jgi:hypothetical protein